MTGLKLSRELLEKEFKKIARNRAKILENFAQAYLAENKNIKISEIELAEQKVSATETRYFFQVKKRTEKHQGEILICAAIKMPDGKIIRGHRHNHCLNTARDMLYRREAVVNAEQGFVTSKGKFIEREEAARLFGISRSEHLY